MHTKNIAKNESYDLKKIQNICFSILIEFDRLCEAHNIKYSLEGGSLLGAVKYKDFVPWDDDIDIVMLRAEYNKFIDVAKKELGNDFILQNHNLCGEFPLNYSKLCYKNSFIYDYDYSHLKKMSHCIFIDIFPLDNVIEDRLKKQIKIVGCLTGAKRTKLRIKGNGKGLKLFIYRLISLLPLKFLNNLIDKTCTKYDKKTCPKVYEICNSNRKFKPLPISYYTDLIKADFRGRKFFISKHYDDFLKSRFGENYMSELPPESCRHPSHNKNIIIYKEYE